MPKRSKAARVLAANQSNGTLNLLVCKSPATFVGQLNSETQTSKLVIFPTILTGQDFARKPRLALLLCACFLCHLCKICAQSQRGAFGSNNSSHVVVVVVFGSSNICFLENNNGLALSVLVSAPKWRVKAHLARWRHRVRRRCRRRRCHIESIREM